MLFEVIRCNDLLTTRNTEFIHCNVLFYNNYYISLQSKHNTYFQSDFLRWGLLSVWPPGQPPLRYVKYGFPYTWEAPRGGGGDNIIQRRITHIQQTKPKHIDCLITRCIVSYWQWMDFGTGGDCSRVTAMMVETGSGALAASGKGAKSSLRQAVREGLNQRLL